LSLEFAPVIVADLTISVDCTAPHDLCYVPGKQLKSEKTVSSTKQWVNSVVVGLNLCPFAKRELALQRARFAVTEARTETELLEALEAELDLLGRDAAIETTLLIHPRVLQDFHDYNQFLSLADGLLTQMHLEGIFQIASFHPDYRFAGTDVDDAENYSNRSPLPMLHILREESVEKAIAAYADVEQIPVRNIELLNSIGSKKLKALLIACVETWRL